MNVAKWRYWKAACWETRTCSLGEGSRKSTTSLWQLAGFLSYIMYVRLSQGWMYLVAILDWYARYVVSWALDQSLEMPFVLRALEQALASASPVIVNSDQGSHFTSPQYIQLLKAHAVQISMDGKGRALDNIFTERLWRTVKYENIYLQDYQSPREARQGIREYLSFYNQQRLHQSLDYATPAEVYFGQKHLSDCISGKEEVGFDHQRGTTESTSLST